MPPDAMDGETDLPPQDAPGDDVPEAEAPPPQPSFLGEVVERRSWPLIAIVFVFAVFLAAVPFLFVAERSPFPEAIAAYDSLCRASRTGDVPGFRALLSRRWATASALDATRVMSGLKCWDRTGSKATLEPVPGRDFGPDRAFVLTLVAPRLPGSPSVRMMFVTEDEVLRWDPDGDPTGS